jgi:photosystem II protein
MTAKIQFLEKTNEVTIPIIKLTKSKNGRTGTATFIFINPLIFTILKSEKKLINALYLVWDAKKILTNDLNIIFKDGKPYLLKAIFIFKNNKEWFNFLNFMVCYSKETGLSFLDSTY